MLLTGERLDATFTALADPTRRAIVARLARGDATVNELAAPFEMTLPGISKHLKVLEHCGLISRSRHAQFRPCHLERAVLDDAVEWIEMHRRVWTERFDKLDAHLLDFQANRTGDEEGSGTTRTRRRASSNTPASSTHHASWSFAA
jgi:DNA-binding transcriptional ArsR family regulator